LVLLGKLSWFLWTTAFGVHIYWLLALGVQLFHPSASASLARFVKNVLKGLLLSLGLGLFGWFIYQAGPGEIFTNLSRLGWLMPVVLLPYFLVYVLDTWGWYLAFGSYAAVRPGYLTLFRVRWAAESINSVVPSAYIGSEALKVYLLHKRGFSGITASTSVVVSKTCQILAEAFFIGLGALAAAICLPAGGEIRGGMMWITLVAFAVTGLIFLLQRRGMFTTVHAVLARFSIRIKAFETNLPKLRKLDDQTYAFYHRDRARFFRTTAVQETGVVLLFKIFGLPLPVAVAYAILRRGRELFYVLVGGALLYSEEASLKRVADQAAKESLTG
jgi:hypothetical protein